MRTLLAVALLGVAPALHAQEPQELPSISDAQIDAAIREGVVSKTPRAYRAGDGTGGFRQALMRNNGVPDFGITVQGPSGRIQTRAAENARKYFPFTRDSLSAAERSPYILVRAAPGAPTRRAGELVQLPPIEHMVLRPVGKQANGEPWPVLQPITTVRDTVTWANVFGAAYTGVALSAYFDTRGLSDREYDVVIIHANGERTFRIGADERRDIR